MPKEIQRMKKGVAPSLIDAATANLLIDAINAIRRLRIAPQGYGTVQFSDNEGVIDLSGLQTVIQQIQNAALQSGNGAATSDQPNTGNGGGGITNASYNSRLTALENRMSAASISAACNPDGTITVTLQL